MKCSNSLRWRLLILAAAIGTLGVASVALGSEPASDWSRPIQVINPVKLPAALPAERIDLGQGYKPSMAMLPSGELVMCSLMVGGGHEWTKLWRSNDFGRTWSEPVRVERASGQDLIGREHFLTSINDGTPNGVLLSTCTILGNDSSCPPDFESHPPAYINRSTDGGRSWTQTQIGPSGFSMSDPYSRIDRNVVEMADGRLVFGVGTWGYPGTENYLWTSTNKGVSWQQSVKTTFGTYNNYKGMTRSYNSEGNVFDEAYYYKDKAGNLVMFSRLDANSPLYPMDNSAPRGSDDLDRTLMATSTDGGLTWGNFKDFGGYGEMYPRATRLADDRVLMTLSQRRSTSQTGLQALLSYDDGQTWDFDSDLIILDANTPLGWDQGGGFGNTIQLPDGSLISCYSFHNEEHGAGNYQTEVVRWAVHAPEPSLSVLFSTAAISTLAWAWRKQEQYGDMMIWKRRTMDQRYSRGKGGR